MRAADRDLECAREPALVGASLALQRRDRLAEGAPAERIGPERLEEDEVIRLDLTDIHVTIEEMD